MEYRISLAIGLVIGVAVACTSVSPKVATGESPKTPKSKPIQATVPQTATVNCGDSADQTSMNQCFALEARQDLKLLDTLMKELGDRLDPVQKEHLEEVQSQWVKYKDAHCEWQAAFFEGGSVQPTMYSTCGIALTLNRIEELKLDLCEGAGMTGPCEESKRYDPPGLTSR